MTTLDSATQPGRENNLNALRLALALMVIVSHSFALTHGHDRNEPLLRWTGSHATFGFVAVDLFFFISGLLITASWQRSRNLEDYLRKRVLRIYPGFIAATLFTGAVVWALSPEYRAANSLFGGEGWIGRLAHDVAFLDNTSNGGPGVFASNPFPGGANGSLWTIQREFLCYLLVAVLGMFGLLRKRWILLLGLGFVFLKYARATQSGINIVDLDRRFLTLFLAGMAAWLWRERIPLSPWLAALAAAGLAGAAWLYPMFPAAIPWCGGYLALWIGYSRPAAFTRWCDRTDLSYGTYLYAFPVQQMLAMHAPLREPWINFALAAPLTLALAWLSWTWIEHPWLRRKSRPAAAAPEPAAATTARG